MVKFYLLAIFLDENFVDTAKNFVYHKMKIQEMMDFTLEK